MSADKKTTPTKKKTAVKNAVAQAAAPKKTVPKHAASAIGFLKIPVYGANGKEVRSIDLPPALFDVAPNDALVYQVVTAMEANARTPLAHTKGRGDVRGGGRKPWKQKGTGRARHGSRRSPIWRGGGVTHGPTSEKDYSRTIPKKMRAKALATVLSAKLRAEEILFVDAPGMKEPKTKEAKAFLSILSTIKGFEPLKTRRNNAALVALGEKNDALEKSFRNIGSVVAVESRNLNPADVLHFRFLIISNPEAALEALEGRITKSK